MGFTPEMITSTMRLCFSSITPRNTCMPYTKIRMYTKKLLMTAMRYWISVVFFLSVPVFVKAYLRLFQRNACAYLVKIGPG